MIGKIPPHRRDGGSTFSALVEYVTDAEKTDGAVWYHNILNEDTAAFEMQATAISSPRCKDPVYHCVLSWPTGERPTPEQAHQAGLMALEEHGFDLTDGTGHQFVIALHKDTEHHHIHISANRVHLQTGEPLHLEWSQRTLHQACRKIEIAQGWSHDKGLYEVAELDGKKVVVKSDYRNERQKGVPTKAQDIEVHTGQTSFARYIKEQCGTDVKAAVKTGDWQQVHRALDQYGVELKPRGQGYVYADRTDPDHYHAKASTISITSAAKLRKVLGDYQPPSPSERQPAIRRYDPDAPDGVLNLEREQIEKRKAERDAAARQRSPNRKRYSENGKRENESKKINYKSARESLYREYIQTARAQRSARRAEKDQALKAQRASEVQRQQQMKRDVKQSASDAWNAWRRAPVSDRVPPAAIRAVIAVERGRLREQLERQRRQERAALMARYGGRVQGQSWHQWIRQKAAEGDETAIRVQRGLDYREQRQRQGQMTGQPQQQGEPYDQSEDALMQAQQASEVVAIGVLDAVLAQIRADDVRSPVYRDDERGIDIARDYGDRIQVLAHDELSLEQTLRIAAARYGDTIQLNGDDDFQRDAAMMAGQLGIKISNGDPDLQQLWREARDEAQGRRPQRPILPRLERQGQEKEVEPPPPPTVPSAEYGEAAETEDADMPDTTPKRRGGRPARPKREPMTPEQREQMRREKDQVKAAADLIAIAERYGWDRKTGTGTAGGETKMTKGTDVMSIRRKAFGDTFAVWLGDSADNGDVFDFLMRENPGMKLQDAIKEAGEYVGVAPVPLIDRKRAEKREREKTQWTPGSLNRLYKASGGGPDEYLRSRGLAEAETGKDCLVSNYHGGTPERDYRGQVQFWYRDINQNLVGFGVKGPSAVTGGIIDEHRGPRSQGLYHTGNIENPRYILACESGLDAESARAVRSDRQDILYVGVGGAMSDEQCHQIVQLAECHQAQVIAGFDADETGDRYTKQLSEILKERGMELRDGRRMLREAGAKDWNDLIRRQDPEAIEEVQEGEREHERKGRGMTR